MIPILYKGSLRVTASISMITTLYFTYMIMNFQIIN